MKIRLLTCWFFMVACVSVAQDLPAGHTRPYLPFPDTLFPDDIVQSLNKSLFYLDSVVYYDYLSGTASWTRAAMYAYTYREDGQRKDEIYFLRSGNDWLPVEKTLYEYDQAGLFRVEMLEPGGENWQAFRQVLYSRNANGDVTEQLTRDRETVTGNWVNRYRYLFGYDEWKQLISRTYQQYTDSLWTNNHRYEWTWEGGHTTEMLRRNWNTADSAYIDSYRFAYEYDGQDLLKVETQYNRTGEGEWFPASRIIYQYDPWGEVLRKLYENYEKTTGNWNPVVDYLYQQDKQQRDTLILYRIYNNTSGVWDENYRYLFEYDTHGNLAVETWQEWKGGWTHDLKIAYFFSRGEEELRVEITDSSMVSCHGYSDGNALAWASGGSPPYTFLWDDVNSSTGPFAAGLEGGRWYRVFVTDAALNTASDSVYMDEPPPVETGDIRGSAIIEPGEFAVYSVPAETGAMYTWEVTGGWFLSGQGGPEIEVLWMDPGTGLVSVTKTGPTGCPGDTSSLEIEIGVIPLVPGGIAAPVFLYPNPGKPAGRVTIEFTRAFSGSWALTDVSGSLVRTGQVSSVFRMEMDVPQLTPGIYYWNFKGDRNYRLKWAVK